MELLGFDRDFSLVAYAPFGAQREASRPDIIAQTHGTRLLRDRLHLERIVNA